MLPFMGTAHVAYLPDGRVIGLSKLARVVEDVARRPQVQERMTEEIANLLVEELARQGRGGGDRGHAYLHDDPRRSQAGLRLRHVGHEGLFRANLSSRSEVMTLIYGDTLGTRG